MNESNEEVVYDLYCKKDYGYQIAFDNYAKKISLLEKNKIDRLLKYIKQ